MGHRANYAIRERGILELRSSRWGARTLPDDLFSGLPAVLDFIRDLPDTDYLYDDVSCEGCLLVDLDQQVVLVEGVSELFFSGLLRRATVATLRQQWAGWTFFRTDDPATDMADYLGFDDALRARLDAGGEIVPISASQLRRDGLPNLATAEIAITDPAGTTHFYLTDHPLLSLLAHGEGICEQLPGAQPAELDANEKLWAYAGIDHQQKRLAIWQDIPEFQFEERLRPFWPGWRIERVSLIEAIHHSGHPQAFNVSETDLARARQKLATELSSPKAAELLAGLHAHVERLQRQSDMIKLGRGFWNVSRPDGLT